VPLGWPRAHFSVQVKSTEDPWHLKSQESVEWLIKHPLPLFLCIVDKPNALLRVYHTAPRFYAWSLPPLPESLKLTPDSGRDGRAVQWDNGETFSLSAPILKATINELLDDDFHRRIWKVLRFWIDVDLENLARIQAGIHSFKMPDKYKTNSKKIRGWVIQGIREAPDLGLVTDHVRECLGYLTCQLYVKGDLAGAARCALLLRHFPGSEGSDVSAVYEAINKRVSPDRRYLHSGVDLLGTISDSRLTEDCDQEREE